MTTFRNEAFEATFDTTNGIATLTWTMPGKANKVDPSLVKTLGESLDWAQSQPDLKGLILTSGHKNFCVGADIDGVYAMEDAAEVLAYVTTLNRLFRRLETLGVPVVAALTGSALGGGFELALSCHRRFALADESAQFGLPEVTLGLIPGAGGTQRWPASSVPKRQLAPLPKASSTAPPRPRPQASSTSSTPRAKLSLRLPPPLSSPTLA